MADQIITIGTGQGEHPAWVDSMSIGVWEELDGPSPGMGLSATGLASSVDPDPDNSEDYAGVGGFNSVFAAYSGSIFVPTLGTRGKKVHYGGGHRDTYMNCLPALDLDARTWELLTQPSTAGPFSNGAALSNGQYTDGTPSPPHTYTYDQYHAPSHSLVCLKSISNINSPDTGTASLAIAQMFSFDTLTWRRSRQLASWSAASSGCACSDTNRNVMWGLNHTNGDFARFDPEGDNGDGTWGTWTLFAAAGVFSDDLAMGHDPVEDVVVVANFNTGRFWRKDPEDMSGARVEIPVSGLPADFSDQSGFDYCAALEGFVFHEARTGDVYVIRTSDGWQSGEAELITVDTNGQSFAATNGFYNRTRPIQWGNKVVQVLTRNINSPTQVMRLL